MLSGTSKAVKSSVATEAGVSFTIAMQPSSKLGVHATISLDRQCTLYRRGTRIGLSAAGQSARPNTPSQSGLRLSHPHYQPPCQGYLSSRQREAIESSSPNPPKFPRNRWPKEIDVTERDINSKRCSARHARTFVLHGRYISRLSPCSPSILQSTLEDGQLTLDAVQRLCHWQNARIARLPH
jgi:hypothetical protein